MLLALLSKGTTLGMSNIHTHTWTKLWHNRTFCKNGFDPRDQSKLQSPWHPCWVFTFSQLMWPSRTLVPDPHLCTLPWQHTNIFAWTTKSALYKWPVFDQDCCVELLVGACMHSHITSCPQSSCLSKYMYPPQTNSFLSILYQFWEHWKYRVKWIASFVEGGINLVYNQAFSPAFPWWEFTVPRVLKLNY